MVLLMVYSQKEICETEAVIHLNVTSSFEAALRCHSAASGHTAWMYFTTGMEILPGSNTQSCIFALQMPVCALVLMRTLSQTSSTHATELALKHVIAVKQSVRYIFHA